MTDKINRTDAQRAYKERKPDAGIFSFQGSDKGCIWLGPALDLSAMENRTRFTLRSGSHPDVTLQTAWNATSGEGFTFEVLERLDSELSPMAQANALADRGNHWRALLSDRLQVRLLGQGPRR